VQIRVGPDTLQLLVADVRSSAGAEPEVTELEWQTRRDRIDTRLRELGWKIVDFVPGLDTTRLAKHAVAELETANGPADYVPGITKKTSR
jgi:hypothetical protein